VVNEPPRALAVPPDQSEPLLAGVKQLLDLHVFTGSQDVRKPLSLFIRCSRGLVGRQATSDKLLSTRFPVEFPAGEGSFSTLVARLQLKCELPTAKGANPREPLSKSVQHTVLNTLTLLKWPFFV